MRPLFIAMLTMAALGLNLMACQKGTPPAQSAAEAPESIAPVPGDEPMSDELDEGAPADDVPAT